MIALEMYKNQQKYLFLSYDESTMQIIASLS